MGIYLTGKCTSYQKGKDKYSVENKFWHTNMKVSHPLNRYLILSQIDVCEKKGEYGTGVICFERSL
jgi:hypothetical protein